MGWVGHTNQCIVLIYAIVEANHIRDYTAIPICERQSSGTSGTDQLVEITKVGGLHHRYEWREYEVKKEARVLLLALLLELHPS